MPICCLATSASVQWVATRTERTPNVSATEFFDRAYARHKQRGQHSPFDHVGCRLDPFPISVGTKPIVERGAIEAIAVRYFDSIDTSIVKDLGDRADAIGAVHMKYGVHAVTKGDVLYVKLVGFGIESHDAAFSRCFWASLSPAALAAAVMMSRLPEYLGR